MTQGANANYSGSLTEQFIEDILSKQMKFYKIDDAQKKLIRKHRDMNMVHRRHEPWYSREQYFANGVYGSQMRTDFLLRCPQFPNGLLIECKYQGQSGTTDEKYPYTYLSLRNAGKTEGVPSIFMLSGEWSRAKIIKDWLRRVCENDPYVTAMFGIEDFRNWANKNLK